MEGNYFFASVMPKLERIDQLRDCVEELLTTAIPMSHQI